MMVSYRRGRKRCKSEWKWEGFAWRRENMKISYYDMVMVVVLFEWNLIHVVWGAEANRKKEKGRVRQ